jgi:diguanylate cyclase (GGDEF)-like protein
VAENHVDIVKTRDRQIAASARPRPLASPGRRGTPGRPASPRSAFESIGLILSARSGFRVATEKGIAVPIRAVHTGDRTARDRDAAGVRHDRRPPMLDHRTLFFAGTVAVGCAGVLLIVAWLQNRSDRTLLFWSIGFALYTAALAMVSARGALPWFVGYPMANAFVVAAYALNWAGLRVFDGRPIPWLSALAGPVLCALAYLSPAVADDYRARVFIISALSAAYGVVMVADLWRGRGDRLRARLALAAAVGVNGVANGVRGVHALTVSPDFDMMGPPQPVLSSTGLVSLLAVLASYLSLMAMSKERASAELRRLAETDALTGAMTRSRLIASVETMIAAAHANGTPLAAVLFDLDGFKAVNDADGHEAGDALLVRFADGVRATLPPGAVFGRVDGGRFAVAIPGDAEEAGRFAETVRRSYAEAAAGSVVAAATVSAGLAALVFGEDADGLASRADTALQAAKAAGRDRVVRAPALNR